MPVIDHSSLYKLVLSNLYKLRESRIVCPLAVTNTVVIMITGMAFYAIRVTILFRTRLDHDLLGQ